MDAVKACRRKYFTKKVIEDESISRYFSNTDMENSKEKNKLHFLGLCFWSTFRNIRVKNMRDAHANYGEKDGLNHNHFCSRKPHIFKLLLEELKCRRNI